MIRRPFPLSGSGQTLVRGIVAIVVLALMTACGGGNRAGENTTAPGVATGSVGFSVEWEPPTTAPSGGANALSALPMAPAIDVCIDYGISRVTMQVLAPGGIDNILVTQSFDCGPDHKGTISGVPAGSNLTLRVVGTVQGSGNDWNGISAPFTLAAGETKNVGKVTMNYTGNIKDPPTILSVSPADNATHVLSNDNVLVVFNERMAINTVLDNEAIVVTDNVSGRVSGTIAYLPANNSALFKPAAPLGSGRKHTVTVNNAVTDMAGLGMAAPFVWHFTTHAKGSWFPPTLIETDNAGDALHPQIAMDGSGNAIVVWRQFDGTRNSISANRYVPGGGWGTATQIEHNAGGADAPQIAMAGNGNAFAVWHQSDGTRYNIWANRYTPSGGWGTTATPLETDNAGDAFYPQVSMDGNGHAVAVWYQNDGIWNNIWAAPYIPVAGVGWAPAILLSTDNTGNAYGQQISMDGSGNAIVVWLQSDGTHYHLKARRFDAGPLWLWPNEWEPATHMLDTGNAGDAYAPQIAMDGTGNAIAVWYQSDGTRYNIWANRYTPSGGWGTATLIETDDAGSAYGPQIAMDGSGNAIVVWLQSDGTRYHLAARRYDAGGAWPNGWGTATLIETDNAGDAYDPEIGMDGSGNAIAVWSKHDGTRYNIWANRYTPSGGWGTATLLETDNTWDAYGSRVAMDGSGNAIAVWNQADSTRYNIWGARFE